MVRHVISAPIFPVAIAQQQVTCPGCRAKHSSHDLVNHAAACPKWSGPGNPAVRHTMVKNKLAQSIRQHGHVCTVEATIYPPRLDSKIAKQKPLQMDIAMGKTWYDVTITTDERSRQRAKQALYGPLAQTHGTKLRVLAFDIAGHIQAGSTTAAKELAKACGTTVSALFTPVSAVVARESAAARLKARDYIAELRRLGLLAGPETTPAPAAADEDHAAAHDDTEESVLPSNIDFAEDSSDDDVDEDVVEEVKSSLKAEEA